MRRFLSIYFSFVKVAVKTLTAHRSAFWAGIVGQWLGYGTTFATLYIVVMQFNVLAGWNADEMIFMYAVNVLSYSIAATMFYNPATTLSIKIRTGEFDSALTKPVSPFLHELFAGVNCGYISHISLSIAVMVFAGLRVGLHFSWLNFIIFTGMLLGAIMVQAALLIIISAASFFLVNENPLFELSDNIQRFTQYPINIYPVFLQVILTFMVPVAFMNFYPASAILHKDNGTAFIPALGYFTPVVGAALLGLSIAVWNGALSKYQSTGT